MLLASRIHNADPAPHRCLLCQERFAEPKTRATTSHVTKLVRRDKYVIATANPANTILNDFRTALTNSGDTPAMAVLGELDAIRGGGRDRHGADAVAHATLVLTRYVAFLTAAGRADVRA
ncbi:hypothetical protein [Curtobacterium sp. MCSS17_016]|uniref:hypothetical protein n=1 Tax=Curtobacterium sp. MCSS17_016 TaxID=2175644 RepID=UPI000DA92ABF|nr:hypothetical protein [Curtobacterium sp. MCSS17_016]WIE81291.1 hypothetical protein DEJ19_018835 [Curtobacterium sp. MCSS17_016]